jgi:peptide/nickel transport system permease protein
MATLELTGPAEAPEADGGAPLKRTSRLGLTVRRFFRRPSAVVGLGILVLLVLFATVGKVFARWGYEEPDFYALGQPPSAEHWFGTTTGGGDVYAWVVRGLGRSLMIGFLSAIGITVIAAVVGTAVAYFEGWFEKVGSWVIDLLMVIPSFLIIALIVRRSSAQSGWVMLVVGLVLLGWVGNARVYRTLTWTLREQDYVKAARFMGVHPFRIIVRHLVPNLSSILIISTVLSVVSSVHSETALSFLGLGIKAPDVSLGLMLATGTTALQTMPWVLYFPAGLLVLLCFACQLVGDGLRDALDPNSASGGKAK